MLALNHYSRSLTCLNMKIEMQQGRDSSELTFSGWDLVIKGKPLDDRGYAAEGFARNHSPTIMTMEFNHEEFKFKLGDQVYDIEDGETAFQNISNKNILLESTSLGFVEILLACSAMKSCNAKSLSFLYIEPKEYRRERKTQVLHRREFDLSGEVPGYLPIPGYSIIPLDTFSQKVVFFAGYESSRLEKALEDHYWIRSKNSSLIFGVPAFYPGWEMNSFNNNIDIISERNLSGGIHFGAASNPLAAFQILSKIHDGLSSGEQLYIVPIGTKPQAIGTALFAATVPNIGILYDHPIKKKNRTGDISSWHLFNIDFN